jgi:hypothetical protein
MIRLVYTRFGLDLGNRAIFFRSSYVSEVGSSVGSNASTDGMSHVVVIEGRIDVRKLARDGPCEVGGRADHGEVKGARTNVDILGRRFLLLSFLRLHRGLSDALLGQCVGRGGSSQRLRCWRRKPALCIALRAMCKLEQECLRRKRSAVRARRGVWRFWAVARRKVLGG